MSIYTQIENLKQQITDLENIRKTKSDKLLNLIKTNSLDGVMNFIEENKDFDINTRFNKRSILIIAMQNESKEVAEYLIKSGCLLTSDEIDYTPLMYACQNGWLDIVKMLIKIDNNLDWKTEDDMTCLMLASYYGHLDVVKYLIEECNVSIDVTDIYGQNALHKACKSEFSNVKVIKYLVEECDMKLDTKDNLERTPVMLAVKNGDDFNPVLYLLYKSKILTT